ncbi:MAG TPA: ElyC/SanA/YdcF family protein [Bacillota bacterium]|nr:ElyC/SanA/YdcF family protein [Bacillota bacterium]
MKSTLQKHGVISLIPFLLLTMTGIPVLVNRFLSPTRPIPARILIVEGWLPLYAFQAAEKIFNSGSYDLLLTTGGPIPGPGSKNIAEYAKIHFQTLGIPSSKIIAIPAPGVNIDRTWTSAVAVKKWLDQNKKRETRFNLVSLGPHTRRSWLTYQKVFASAHKIGIISIPEVYTPRRWWYTRRGYRILAEEFISYLGFKMLH